MIKESYYYYILLYTNCSSVIILLGLITLPQLSRSDSSLFCKHWFRFSCQTIYMFIVLHVTHLDHFSSVVAVTWGHNYQLVTCLTELSVGFLPCDAMLVQYMLSSCVRLSVCLSQAGIVSKRPEESSCFLARRLPSTYPTLFCKEIWVHLKKIRVLPSGTATSTTTILQPLYRSTCISRHLQSRTGGFCWCQVLLSAFPCWRHPVHSD